MKKLKKFLINLIYPPKCIFCGTHISNADFAVCEECAKTLPYTKRYCHKCGDVLDRVYGDNFCTNCKKVRKPYIRVFAPLIYKEDVRNSILRFKYYGKLCYAKTYAAFILTELRKNSFFPDIITYVPIHFLRKNKRGYNQSELIAKELAKMMDVPCIKLLKKTTYTQKLAKLSPSLRRFVVKDTYGAVSDMNLRGESVLLIDDIITTTSTATECSRVLKASYGCSVYVAAVSSTTYF